MELQLKRYHTCVDPALDIFTLLAQNRYRFPPRLRFSIWATYLDLRFLNMFFLGLGFPGELLEADWMLRFTFMAQKFGRTAKEFKMQVEGTPEGERLPNWETITGRLKVAIRELKLQVREMCILLLEGAFRGKYSFQLQQSCRRECGLETLSFIGCILANLDVLRSSVFPIDSVKQQFASIERKLLLFGSFVNVLNEFSHRSMRNMYELIYHIQNWASHISCLACLYWVHLTDESLMSSMEIVLSCFMQKSLPYHPGTMDLFLDVFKRDYHKIEGTIFPILLKDYVDFLLEQYVKDDVEVLREGLTFLFSFVMDSPTGDKEIDFILAKIYAIVDGVSSIDNIFETNTLSDFLNEIDEIKAKLRELYVVTPLSLQLYSPTNIVGFLDSLVETLHNMLEGGVDFIPSVRKHVIEVHEELATLMSFLQNNLESENKNILSTNLYTQIVKATHYSSYVVKLCPNTSFPVWYGILCLPNVIQDIKLLNDEVKRIEGELHMCDKRAMTIQVESSISSLPQATTSKHEGAFIGFEEDINSILDNLLGGQKNLTIISISGMPGQGKTTLARRIHNNPSIRRHFHKVSWCYVSRECNKRKILGNILWGDGDKVDDNIDLVELVWKALKGRRYLLVLDDIWNIDAWHLVQESFPNDNNGSRILFTSRNDILCLQCKPNSISHYLRLFSKEESLDLLKDKLSYNNGFPVELHGVAEQIVDYCKGLPLAVALIASHLRKIKPELHVWMKVSEELKSHLSKEGCMHIIELSYQCLPHHLKPCFLYFSVALGRGVEFRAGHLLRLWIAEGFVKGNKMWHLEDLANKYLEYLASQNLVIVTKRGSMGKIRHCYIHDLIYDLCFQKAVEENFLHLTELKNIIGESYPPSARNYNSHHHRVCIRDSNQISALLPSSSILRLPSSQVHSLLSSFIGVVLIQHNSLCSLMSNFRVLTVLEMTHVYLGSKFPEVILYNIHLRHLSFRGSFSFLPSSISNLWNLETLIIIPMEHIVCFLPKSLWEIKSLSYVRVISSCLQFDGFRQNVSGRVGPINIETLRGIILHYDDLTQEFIRRLSSLRKLDCFYDKEFHPEWFSMFESLRKLESLKISPSPVDVIPKLSWINLQLHFPDTLKKLCLWDLELPWSAMSKIGKLPNLQVLKLCSNACEGTTWDLGDDDFQNLKHLTLQRMNVEKIIVSDEDDDIVPFPYLEELLLFFCTKLEVIPPSIGNIYSLKAIYVTSCPIASDIVKAIVEQQQDIGNQDFQFVSDS